MILSEICLSYLCIICWLKVSKVSCKACADEDCVTLSIQTGGIESSSDDHSSPPASSQVSSRRTSIGPQPRDDAGHISISESQENSIVRAKQQCGAEIFNFEHLKMQLDKLTGQNREKQRQSDAESGTSTVSPSPSCASISSQTPTATSLSCVGSWPSGLNRMSSVESDLLLFSDSGVSSIRSATDSTSALAYKCTGVEQKLPLSDRVCATSHFVPVQGASLALGVAGQQVRCESSVSSCHHVAASLASESRPSACPQFMNVGNTFSAFHQPGFLHELAQLTPAYCAEWQQQVFLQQMQQQSLMAASVMQAQQCQQMLRLQQQLQQQQAVQFMQSLHHPDTIPSAFVGLVPVAAELPTHHPQWQTQLTSLLIESGLLPGKAQEIVQQLQHVMMPCPLQVPGNPALQLLSNSGCSVDFFSQMYNHLPPSQFSGHSLPRSLLTSFSNVQAAYAQVVQLLSRPNPLLTPELLEAMFAQLPPPLNLNILNSSNQFEAVYAAYMELLLMQIGQLPSTPVQLTAPAAMSMHEIFGNPVTSNHGRNSVSLNKSVGSATVHVAGIKDNAVHTCTNPVVRDSKQISTPVKATRASYTGVDGSNAGSFSVTPTYPLNRGPSMDSESGDVPGAKLPGVLRSGLPGSRHHNVPLGNGAKMSGSSVPKKNVDCPQGLADLDMALKEKLRPRTTKGMGPSVPEHTKASTPMVVSSHVVCSASSPPSQAATASAPCDLEHTGIIHVNVSNSNSVITPRNTLFVTYDASTVPKLNTLLVTKCAAAVVNEKADAVRKLQVPVTRETVSKDDGVTTDTAACPRTVSAILGNVPLFDVGKVMVKPISSSVCMNVSASSVQLAKSVSQSYETASHHCLPSAAVSLPLMSVISRDASRHVSDSAIAATTTQLAQKHLQKKMAAIGYENASAADVTTTQSHPVTVVSCTCMFCLIKGFSCLGFCCIC